MITNKNICLIHTNSNRKTKSIYDEYKKNERGTMYMRCPQSGIEIPIHFQNEVERMEWINLKKEIREEMRMVS
jgi:hypothetical protein